jgi:hypothetical protein
MSSSKKQQPKKVLPTGAVQARDVEVKKVNWLWRERIPKGMLSFVAGKRDVGKGLFGAHLAADVSRKGGNVIYCPIEDDHGAMTKPRLIAAGANMDRVTLWRPVFPRDLYELSEMMESTGAKLVVIDPIGSALSGVSRHADSMRDVTTPLARLAEKHNAAVVLVEHVLKKVTMKMDALNAVGGQVLPAACRMGFLYGEDPEDPDRRLLACVKSNVRKKPDAVALEIDTSELEIVGEIPSLNYDGECDVDPIRLVASEGEPGDPGRKPEKRAQATEWLIQYLAAAAGPVPSKQVQEDAKVQEISARTVRRAADELGVIRTPSTGGPKCTWELPDAVKQAMGIPTGQQGSGGGQNV